MHKTPSPVFIINAEAGSAGKLSEALWTRIRTTTQVCEITDPADVPRCAADAVRSGPRRVIVAGGDGSLNGAINGLAPFLDRVELAIMPLGTGNDLARGVGMPVDDLERAFEIALTGRTARVDLVRIVSAPTRQTRYFINMCYGGFGGRVADEVEQSSKVRWGFVPYWITLLRKALDLPEHDVQLEADGVRFQARVHGLLIANSCFMGGGVAASPQARINDGMFDVALVPVQSFWSTLKASVDLIRGQIHENEQLVTFLARKLSIDGTPAMKFTADGEPAPPAPLTLEALPNALTLVVNLDSPALSEAGETGHRT